MARQAGGSASPRTRSSTLYLTLAPYGGNIEGVRAASLAYFGKEPTRLTIAEAALLVALPQSPEARRPDRDPDAARAARDRVLDRLVARRRISAPRRREAAKTERVPTRAPRLPDARRAPRRARRVAAHPARDAHPPHHRPRPPGGARDARRATAPRRFGPKLSVAIVVADHMSGESSPRSARPACSRTQRAGYVDMTRAVRSPGSTLKPLIYGLAFELGLAHPESLIEDRPTAFGGYAPLNFDGHFRGTVTIREALTQSLNIPAIVVLDAVGPARLVARLKRAGATPMLPDAVVARPRRRPRRRRHHAPRPRPALCRASPAAARRVPLRDGVADRARAEARAAGARARSRPGMSPTSSPTCRRPTTARPASSPTRPAPPTAIATPGRSASTAGTSSASGSAGRTARRSRAFRASTGAAPILFEAFDRIGPQRAPLPAAAAGVLVATTAELPPPLRRFRHPDDKVVIARHRRRRSPSRSRASESISASARRSDAAGHQGAERRAALHLLCQWRAVRHRVLRWHDVLGAEGPGFFEAHGDRRARRVGDGNGVRRVARRQPLVASQQPSSSGAAVPFSQSLEARQPAASAAASEQNQRSPFASFIVVRE